MENDNNENMLRAIESEEDKYLLVFDSGKPYTIELSCNSKHSLAKELTKFYNENKHSDYPFDCQVLRFVKETGEYINITESQFVEEIVGDILGEQNE